MNSFKSSLSVATNETPSNESKSEENNTRKEKATALSGEMPLNEKRRIIKASLVPTPETLKGNSKTRVERAMAKSKNKGERLRPRERAKK